MICCVGRIVVGGSGRSICVVQIRKGMKRLGSWCRVRGREDVQRKFRDVAGTGDDTKGRENKDGVANRCQCR